MDSDNPVTWYCAFWTLVPLALNSMTQPSGQIVGLPTKYGFALRSAPVLCASDALMVLALEVYWTAVLRSPRAAARKIAHMRFQDWDEASQTGSLRELQHNTAFRLCVFFLGALPQAIKLCGMTGVLWTKVWGVMFLSSFAVIEVIVVFGGRGHQAPVQNTIVSTDRDWTFSFGRLILCGNMTFSLYCSGLGVFKAVESVCGPILDVHIAVYLTITGLGNACLLLVMKKRKLVRFCSGLTVAVFAASIMSSFKGYSVVSKGPCLRPEYALDSPIKNVRYFVITVLTVYLALFATIQGYQELSKQTNRSMTRYIDMSLGVYFIWLNWASTVLFYAFKYDPKGTIKPPWTEYLG